MNKLFKKLMLQMYGDLLTNYGVGLEIDITPDLSPTWVELGEGLDNLAEALNEVINQYQFLNKGGYAESFVTGMQPIITLTGVRMLDDAAQNFIFGKKYELLKNRKSSIRLTVVNPSASDTVITFNDITLANIQEFGGGSVDGAGISVEFHSSEKPVTTGGDLIASLAVVSVAGTLAGDTSVYVNPTIEGGNIYKYQIAASVTIPVYDQDMVALTTWDGVVEITAATGQEILIVECTAGNLARKAGKATVTAQV